MKFALLCLLLLLPFIALSSATAAPPGGYRSYFPLAIHDIEPLRDTVGLFEIGGEDETIFSFNRADGTPLSKIPILAQGRLVEGPHWSPDNGQLAFVFSQSGYRLYLVNASGTNLRYYVNTTEYVKDLRWSPDGSALLYQQYDPASAGYFLYRLTAIDGTIQRVGSQTSIQNSEWSPDGSKIIYTADVDSNDYRVFIADSDGSNERAVTPQGTNHWFRRWLQDSSGFIASIPRQNLIYYDADGTNPMPLTNEANGLAYFNFDPYHDRFIYAPSVGTARHTLYLQTIPLTTPIPIGTDICIYSDDTFGCRIERAAWADTGNALIYETYEEQTGFPNDALWHVDLDQPIPPTEPLARGVESPAWLTGERYVVVVSSQTLNYYPLLMDLVTGSTTPLTGEPRENWRYAEWRFLPRYSPIPFRPS